MEPVDTLVVFDEMETPQIHEEEVAREEPPIQVDLHTGGQPVVVESPVAAAPTLVKLERSQRTRASPFYLEAFLCDAVDNPPSVIVKKIWGTSN